MDILDIKKIFVYSLLIISTSVIAVEQNYFTIISQASKFQTNKEFQNAATAYEKAFTISKGSTIDYYNAACSWAKTGNSDNAFRNLALAFEQGYLPLEHVKNDSDLESLHTDERWDLQIKSLKIKIDNILDKLDPELITALKSIDEKDQRLRKKMLSVDLKNGPNSPEMKSLWEKQNKLDKENLIQLEAIIKKYGYPGKTLAAHYSEVGFLVIQHSSLKVQERYLPLLKKLATEKEIHPSSVAMLIDRVHTTKGENQIYGTQIKINKSGSISVPPIEDRKNVDSRRAAVGLPPLSQYIEFIKQQISKPNS